MSEEPKLIGVKQAAVEKSLWEKLHLFERQKKKLVLNAKMFCWLAVIVILLALVIQFFQDRHSPKSSSNIASAPEISLTSLIFDIPSLVTKQKEKVSGKSVNNVVFSAPRLISRPRNLSQIPPGSILWAKLVSGASNGLVRAEVTDALIVNGEYLIPEGAILVGNGSSTEERLLISFSQVVFRDGTIGTIDGHGCDKSDKIVGLKGSKLGNKALHIAGSIGLGFVGGFSEGLQETEGQQGAAIRKSNLKNALLNATTTTALEQSKNLMSELKDRVPVIEVRAGTEICVLLGSGQ